MEVITTILEEKGFVVSAFRDVYLSVKWSDPVVNMQKCHEYVHGRPSEDTEELMAILEEHGWRVALEYFVPIEWGFVITTRDS